MTEPALEIEARSWHDVIWGLDSFGLLFVLLIIDYVVMMLLDSHSWDGMFRTVPIAVTVLFALHTSGARPAVVRFAVVAVVVALVAALVQGVANGARAQGISFFLVGVLLVVAPIAVVRRILQHDRVDVETMLGAVDVYIMIGLVFSVVFVGIAKVSGPAHPFLSQPPVVHPVSDYVYLSFVTLTTVGFGDLTPYTRVARSVVVLEALIGQIFLVVLVARLVSLYSTEGGVRTRFFPSLRPRGHRDGVPSDTAGNPAAGPSPGSAGSAPAE